MIVTNHLREWLVVDQVWELGHFPKIMGIVNVTPDSFSDGGAWANTEAAVSHALQLAEQGADILDIGGESTRPGAEPVSETEELYRVVPVIEQLASRTDVTISIDTMKAAVAKAALDAGATIINDVSAGTHDLDMINVAAGSNCGIILMHMLGNPQTMQTEPQYDDVVAEICEYLQTRVETFKAAGIDPRRIMLDPGVGFGKTAQHNLDILSNIHAFRSFNHPVLIGHSRKRFLSKIVHRPVEERLAGTIGVSIALAQQHADILRVHDVAAVKDALIAWRAISPLQ